MTARKRGAPAPVTLRSISDLEPGVTMRAELDALAVRAARDLYGRHCAGAAQSDVVVPPPRGRRGSADPMKHRAADGPRPDCGRGPSHIQAGHGCVSICPYWLPGL
jgi:hypothetical protein